MDSSPADAWEQATDRLRTELVQLRAAFDADWAVIWGPTPLTRTAPFASVLIEDRSANLPTALGFTVPVLGNPWAEAIYAGGGAFTDDAPNDPRLGLHARLIETNRIRSIASGAVKRGDEVLGFVELYSQRPMRRDPPPVPALQRVATLAAQLVGIWPRASVPPTSVPSADPMTAAALHDLKSALAAQTLLIASLEKDVRAAGKNPSGVAEQLESMQASLDVLRESVGHATELSRVMTFGVLGSSTRAVVDLAGIIRLALVAIPQDLRERVTVSIDPSLQEGYALPDPAKLLRALMNLVHNAALAIQRLPEATVSVRADSVDSDVVIEVEDAGRGIPADVLPRLFQPGVSTRDRPEGHGYGLYSVKQAVAALGGTVALYSVPGRGAKFIVRLPKTAVGIAC